MKYRFTPESFDALAFEKRPGHWFYARVATADGHTVAVEDYAAKPANTPYTTWLNVDTGLTPVVFSRDTIPVWSNRLFVHPDSFFV